MLMTRSATRFPSMTEFTRFTTSLMFCPFISVEMLLMIPYASVMAVGSGVVTMIASSAAFRKERTLGETPAPVSMKM